MSTELAFRTFVEKNDLDDQRKLFGLSFPETLGSAVASTNHYGWKFNSFPGEPSSYQYVSTDQKQMLGYYAAIPFGYRIDGKKYTCGMVCDVMTHPESRGKGVFTKLGRFSTDKMREAGIHFTTGYPIRPEVIPGHLKVGWQKVLRMPMYIKVLGSATLLPKGFRGISLVVDPFLRLLNFLFSYHTNKYIVEFLEPADLSQNKVELSAFLEAWMSEQKNALEKTFDFLIWRMRAPETDYKIAVVRSQKDKSIVGLSIVRPTNLKGVEVLAILDIMLLCNYFDAASMLINKLSAFAIEIRKDALVCMSTKKWAKTYRFLSNLLIPTSAVFTLIIKKLDSSIDDSMLFDEDRWHLFWIDSDDL